MAPRRQNLGFPPVTISLDHAVPRVQDEEASDAMLGNIKDKCQYATEKKEGNKLQIPISSLCLDTEPNDAISGFDSYSKWNAASQTTK